MTTFDEREKAFENRFVHDEHLRFRAEARRNHAAGLWAAGLLGLSGAEADRYAEEVLAAATLGNGSETVISKLAEDLRAASPPVSEHLIRLHMDHALAEATQHLMTE